MKTIIISGFPGTGKSFCTKEKPDFQDVDPAKFSWSKSSDGNKQRSSIFPARYIHHIKTLIGTAPVIFVSSHKKVRDALMKDGIDFVLVYPKRSLKEEYIARYRGRGNDHPFIAALEENWDEFLDDMEQQQGCQRVELESHQFLSDVLPSILQNAAHPHAELGAPQRPKDHS